MDSYGVIDFQNEKTILFLPKLDNTYKIWMTVLNVEQYKEKYTMVDEIYYVDYLDLYLKDHQPETIFVNKGVNSDSGLTTCIPDAKYL